MERAKSLHGRLNRQNCKGPESGLRRKKLFQSPTALPQVGLNGGAALQNHVFRRLRGVNDGKALGFFLGQNPVALAHPLVKIKALGVKTAF